METNISGSAVNTIGKQTLWQRIWKAKIAYLFILPLFIVLALFCYYPPINGLVMSFFQWDGINDATFLGFDNYKALFKDSIFLNSIPTMFIIMLPKLLINIVIPLVVAEILFSVKSARMQNAYRILILLPIVAPGVVNLLVWQNVYEPNSGLMTSIAHAFGIGTGGPINWLGDKKYVIFSIIFMGFPWIGGTGVLIYMSGLMNISGEMLEASKLDGASTIKRIFLIDIPLLMGQIRYFLLFGIIGGFQDYGVQVVLTNGGPGYHTYVPGFYMFNKAFGVDNKYGYACAIGAVLFAAIMLVTVVANKLTNSKKFDV